MNSLSGHDPKVNPINPKRSKRSNYSKHWEEGHTTYPNTFGKDVKSDAAYRILTILMTFGYMDQKPFSQTYIQKISEKSLSTVRRALPVLIKLGYLEIIKPYCTTTNTPTMYRLLRKFVIRTEAIVFDNNDKNIKQKEFTSAQIEHKPYVQFEHRPPLKLNIKELNTKEINIKRNIHQSVEITGETETYIKSTKSCSAKAELCGVNFFKSERRNANKSEIDEIVTHLNKKTGKQLDPSNPSHVSYINARFKQGYRTEHFIKVIDNKVFEMIGGTCESLLRPSFLFGNKFDEHLNNLPTVTREQLISEEVARLTAEAEEQARKISEITTSSDDKFPYEIPD